MATLNNLYVFVETEDVSYASEISSHPVEKGIEVSDHIKQGPCELSISGKIVKSGSRKASNILSRLRKELPAEFTSRSPL